MSRNRAPSPSLLGNCELPRSAYVRPLSSDVLPEVVDLDLEDSDPEEIQEIKVEQKPYIKPETIVGLEDDYEEDDGIEFIGRMPLHKKTAISNKVTVPTTDRNPQTNVVSAEDRLRNVTVSSANNLVDSSNGSRQRDKNNDSRNGLPPLPPPPDISTRRVSSSLSSSAANVTSSRGSKQNDCDLARETYQPRSSSSSSGSSKENSKKENNQATNKDPVLFVDITDNRETDISEDLHSGFNPTNAQEQVGKSGDDRSSSRSSLAVSSKENTDSREQESLEGLDIDNLPELVPPSNSKESSTSRPNLVQNGSSGVPSSQSTNNAIPPIQPILSNSLPPESSSPITEVIFGEVKSKLQSIIVQYEGGRKEEFVSLKASTETMKRHNHEPKLVSGSCQTSSSVCDGQFDKTASVDVTKLNSQHEDRYYHQPTGKKRISLIPATTDKSKRFREETPDPRDRRQESRSQNRINDNRSHEEYLKAQERRHNAEKIPVQKPKFETEEQLILMLRSCYNCNITFTTRRDGVDHQKKTHNLKHCSVCFVLLSCKGNTWKDHLLKYHAIKPTELAHCPFCNKGFSFEGMYQHIGKGHLIKKEEEKGGVTFPPTLTSNETLHRSPPPSSANRSNPPRKPPQTTSSHTTSQAHNSTSSQHTRVESRTAHSSGVTNVARESGHKNVPEVGIQRSSTSRTKIPTSTRHNENNDRGKSGEASSSNQARSSSPRPATRGQTKGPTVSGLGRSTTAKNVQNSSSSSSTKTIPIPSRYSTPESDTLSLRQVEKLQTIFKKDQTPGGNAIDKYALEVDAPRSLVKKWLLSRLKEHRIAASQGKDT